MRAHKPGATPTQDQRKIQPNERPPTGRFDTRREGLCSTTTERCMPPRLVNATVAAGLRGGGDFFSTARTSSRGSSISPAAIATCSSTSSVRSRAAEIASSRVGGSWRTRRRPYLVFQVVLADVLMSGPLVPLARTDYYRIAAT